MSLKGLAIVLTAVLGFMPCTLAGADGPEGADLASVVVRSGIARKAVKTTLEELRSLADRDDAATDEVMRRRESAVAAVGAVLSEEEYAKRAAVVLRSSFSEAEVGELARVFSAPVMRKWLEVLDRKSHELKKLDEDWLKENTREYLRHVLGIADEGQETK